MKTSLSTILDGIQTVSQNLQKVCHIWGGDPSEYGYCTLTTSAEKEGIFLPDAVSKKRNGVLSAHEMIEVASLKNQALNAGQEVLNALKRFPLLDTPDLKVKIFVFPSHTPEDAPSATLIIGCIGLHHSGLRLEDLAPLLEALLEKIDRCPPKALRGTLRQFTINGTTPLMAPSPQAAAYLWKLSKNPLSSITETLDPDLVLSQLDILETQAIAS